MYSYANLYWITVRAKYTRFFGASIGTLIELLIERYLIKKAQNNKDFQQIKMEEFSSFGIEEEYIRDGINSLIKLNVLKIKNDNLYFLDINKLDSIVDKGKQIKPYRNKVSEYPERKLKRISI